MFTAADTPARLRTTDPEWPDVSAAQSEHISILPLRELGELTQALLGTTTVDSVLRRVIVAARYLIPAADLVSITLRQGDGDYFTPVQTDPEAGELDQLQYKTGEGPCLDAADPTGPAYAHSGDLAAESAWPVFGPKAAEHGYASVLSTELLTAPDQGLSAGALNIYSRERDGLGAARDTAFLLATHASLALAAAHEAAVADGAVTKAQAVAANLRRALDSRTVIGQAMGILMARRRLTGDEAFQVLSRASQNHNIKLAYLAEILTTHPDTADQI